MPASRGRKRRFFAYGVLNVLLTNLLLQGLLLVTSTGLATLCSQILNLGLGFVLYGKRVFRVSRLRKRAAFSYALMAVVLWWANWAGITVLVAQGLQRNLAALILVPVLAAISYTIQKLLVFRSA